MNLSLFSQKFHTIPVKLPFLINILLYSCRKMITIKTFLTKLRIFFSSCFFTTLFSWNYNFFLKKFKSFLLLILVFLIVSQLYSSKITKFFHKLTTLFTWNYDFIFVQQLLFLLKMYMFFYFCYGSNT